MEHVGRLEARSNLGVSVYDTFIENVGAFTITGIKVACRGHALLVASTITNHVRGATCQNARSSDAQTKGVCALGDARAIEVAALSERAPGLQTISMPQSPRSHSQKPAADTGPQRVIACGLRGI